jgi:hypothetical protein
MPTIVWNFIAGSSKPTAVVIAITVGIEEGLNAIDHANRLCIADAYSARRS